MTPEQRERVVELFAVALKKASSQREAYLLENCDDEEVRVEVRSLFEHAPETFAQGPVVLQLPVISHAALSKISERYEDLVEVGRGGMGIVYKTRDRQTGGLVALKVLKSSVASDEAGMQRFKNELNLARQITHKNVCRVHQFELIEDSAYISMEFVDGESLRDVFTRFGGLPLRKGIQIASQICAGLREAHNQGIVHRDLKPENIMIDPDGNGKIMDFGIARSVGTGTTQWTVIGTPPYMAPEQYEGKSDARSDIYSLGLILYEMFTGNKRASESPLRPREIEPTIPIYIEETVLRCLKTNPADRFQSVDELETALRGNLAPVTDDLQKSRASATFSRRSAVLIIAACALLAAGLSLGFFLGRRRGVATPAAPSSTVASATTNNIMHHGRIVNYVAFSPDGRYVASASEDENIKVWDIAKRAELPPPPLKGSNGVLSIAFIGSRWLASGTSEKDLRIWDLDTHLPQQISGHSLAINSVAFTASNGGWLATGSKDGTVRLWRADAQTGSISPVRVLKTDKSSINDVAFSDDGKWLASGRDDGELSVWNAITDSWRTWEGHRDSVQTVAFSRDGRWLASAGFDNLIEIWEVGTLKKANTLAGHKEIVWSVCFGPDGRLVSASEDGTVRLWDLSSGQLDILVSAKSGANSVAISPDGSQLAVGFSDGNVKLMPLKN